MIIYSIIIPHYKVPKLLIRCLESIPQRDDVQVIVVDDNSPDADTYLERFPELNRPNLEFIRTTEGKGAGYARNVGLKHAKGKWILFADADDFYCPGFLDILDEYRESDLEILYFNTLSVNSDTLLSGRNRAAIGQQIIGAYDGSGITADNVRFFVFGVWNKMFSLNFVRRYNLTFAELPKGNDQRFVLLASYFAKKWVIDKRALYTLTFRKGSITYSRMTKEKYLADFEIWSCRAKLYDYMGHPEWNENCCRGYRYSDCLYKCKKKYEKKPNVGKLMYRIYFTHWLSIKWKSYSYVRIIKQIEKEIKKNIKNEI